MRLIAQATCLAAWLFQAGCGPPGGGEPPRDDAGPMWQGDFPVGPHAVGFRIDTLTRASQEGQREITLSVWYPAESDGSGEPMEVGDYFRAAVREGQLTESVGLDEGPGFAAVMTGSSTALSADEAEAGLHTAVGARLGATRAGGTHPVVLWSSRHATALAQAPLSEVLASHGFLTVSAWVVPNHPSHSSGRTGR